MKKIQTVLSMGLFAALAVSPSRANVVDLTVAGNCTPITAGNLASCSIGTAVFTLAFQQSTGTGVIDPFVRQQDDGINTGMNTDANNVYDDLNGAFTHSIKVNQFGVLTNPLGNGIDYVRFLLDINEVASQGQEFLILDSLKIVTVDAAGGGSLTTIAAATANAGADIYDMNPPSAGSGPNGVKLNYNLNPGSGAGDMFVYIPASLFAGTGNNFLYLYSQFGNVTPFGLPQGYDTSDGFEEWSRVNADGGGAGGGNPVPEPSQFLSLFVVGIPVVIGYIRKRRAAQVA